MELFMRKILIFLAFALSSLSAPVFADSQETSLPESLLTDSEITSESLDATPKKIIINFSKVNAGIYRGARLTSFKAAEYLKSLNVKNIINLQGGDLTSKYAKYIPWLEPGETPENINFEKANALSLGIGFFHNPLNSLEPVTMEEDRAIDQTLEFMHDKNNQPIFIHCEHGADRTGLLVALYRVKYEGVAIETARNEWIKNGHDRLHQIFTGDLDTYYYAKVRKMFEDYRYAF